MQTMTQLFEKRPALGAAAAIALLLCACSTLGSGDRTRTALYLENAAQYYDQGRYDSAFQQWAKVLDLDPMNDKARLGQGMARYQLGRREEPEALLQLAEAEERLGELRHEDLDGQEWKAELGYGLVQERLVELLDRKVRLLEFRRDRTGSTNEEELGVAQGELTRRIRLAEQSFEAVLGRGEQEAQYQLACMLGLSRMAALRGDYESCLRHAHKYEQQVVRSKNLWREAMERFESEAPLYERKLRGAERQEAALRDLLGAVYFKLGRHEEAENELNVVIELDAQRASAYLNRGIVRQQRSDWDRARQDLRTFLAMTTLSADDPTVVEATERLRVVEHRLQQEDELLRQESGGSSR